MSKSPSVDIEAITASLLTPINLNLISYQTIQSLWAGYGKICRLQVASPNSPKNPTASSEVPFTLVLKLINPPPTHFPPSESHLRKVISYSVETHFYRTLAPLLPPDAAVARCLASTDTGISEEVGTRNDVITLVLEDLRTEFPIAGEKRGTLSTKQVEAALQWLGTFHGFWWRDDQRARFTGTTGRAGLRRPPLEEAMRGDMGTGVWLNGGYTYLATRREEYDNLARDADAEWSTVLCTPHETDGLSLAERVARNLAPSTVAGETTNTPRTLSSVREFETLIHGDVKSENLFTTKDEGRVAFFDFQYAGLGLGASDLAKLFTCSVPEAMLTAGIVGDGERLAMQDGEQELLVKYLQVLCKVSGKRYEWEVFVRHWETALVDWLRFQASWGFWGNTEWLEARVRHIVQDEAWLGWLDGQTT